MENEKTTNSLSQENQPQPDKQPGLNKFRLGRSAVPETESIPSRRTPPGQSAPPIISKTVRPRKTEEEKGVQNIFLYAVVLMFITAIVAGLLAFINDQTKDIIAQAELEKRQSALQAIFPDADDFVDVTGLLGEDGEHINTTAIYTVHKNGELIGYCASVTAQGFSSTPIEMMVGSDLLNRVTSLQVISHSETPGIGDSAINNETFLEQFTGATRPIGFDNKITAVSGATYTSGAIKDGINSALGSIDTVRLALANQTGGGRNDG